MGFRTHGYPFLVKQIRQLTDDFSLAVYKADRVVHWPDTLNRIFMMVDMIMIMNCPRLLAIFWTKETVHREEHFVKKGDESKRKKPACLSVVNSLFAFLLRFCPTKRMLLFFRPELFILC